MERLLTIGIPTYNRGSLLKEQLKRLYASNNINDDIQILVCDNCSEDDTKKILVEFKESNRNFDFHINNENLGYDGNIFEIYKRANGKYIWFLSDDDELIQDSINYVLAKLKYIEDCGVIVVPQSVGNKLNIEKENDIIPYNPVGEKIGVLIGERERINSEKLRLNILMLSSQVSSCIVLKKVTLIEKGEGGGLMHSKLSNLNLIETPYYYIIDKGLVKPGKKENISKWFMESTLFGIRRLYTSNEMKFSKGVSDLVSTQTCNFGLYLMQKRYNFSKKYFRYREIDEKLIHELKIAYGDSYSKLEKNVLKALKVKKIKYFYMYIIFPIMIIIRKFKQLVGKIRRIYG